METQNCSIRMSSATAKALKVLAAQVGATQGQLLRAFCYLAKVRHVSIGDLAQAVVAADQIPEPGFVGDNRDKHIEYLDRVAHLAFAEDGPDDYMVGSHFKDKALAVAAGEPVMGPEAGLAIIKAVVHRDEDRPLAMNLGDDMTPATDATLEATPERIATLREEA